MCFPRGFVCWENDSPPVAFSANKLCRRLRAVGVACLLSLPLALQAEQPSITLTSATPPPGTNPAVFPLPRVEGWTAHFLKSLERTKEGNVDLLFDGDSITDGWMGIGRPVWTKNYGSLHAFDFGIGGDCIEQLLWRLDHGQVAGLHPKMVVLLIGTNNLRECTDVQVAEGVTAVVQEYQKLCPDAVILLQGIFPRSEKASDPVRQKIKNVNERLAKLGDGKKVIYMDFGDELLQPDGTLTKDVMPDFLHPNAKGYEIWAAAIRPEIEKVFGPSAPAN